MWIFGIIIIGVFIYEFLRQISRQEKWIYIMQGLFLHISKKISIFQQYSPMKFYDFSPKKNEMILATWSYAELFGKIDISGWLKIFPWMNFTSSIMIVIMFFESSNQCTMDIKIVNKFLFPEQFVREIEKVVRDCQLEFPNYKFSITHGNGIMKLGNGSLTLWPWVLEVEMSYTQEWYSTKEVALKSLDKNFENNILSFAEDFAQMNEVIQEKYNSL